MVQPTSIEAYRSNAETLSNSRQIVAREILRLTREGKPAWIRLVAENLHLDKSGVSGRFNDLHEKYPDGFMLDGKRYKMTLLNNRVFDPLSGKGGQYVQAWALVLHQAVQVGKQVELF